MTYLAPPPRHDDVQNSGNNPLNDLPGACPLHAAQPTGTCTEDTELEERLTAIWRDELSITDIGPDDNFFDLGGQSVLLIRVHHRLTRELKRQVPIVSLFRYPTIRALARQLSGGEERDSQGDLVAERRLAARQRLDSRRSLRRPAESGPPTGRPVS
jgi:aryl carrier-like protein